MKKRMMSLLLAMVMVLGMMPMPVQTYAAEGEGATCTCTTKCAENSVNSDCAVCDADLSGCAGEETAAAATRVIYMYQYGLHVGTYCDFFDADGNELTVVCKELEGELVQYTIPAEAKYYELTEAGVGGGGGGGGDGDVSDYPELPANAIPTITARKPGPAVIPAMQRASAASAGKTAPTTGEPTAPAPNAVRWATPTMRPPKSTPSIP